MNEDHKCWQKPSIRGIIDHINDPLLLHAEIADLRKQLAESQTRTAEMLEALKSVPLGDEYGHLTSWEENIFSVLSKGNEEIE